MSDDCPLLPEPRTTPDGKYWLLGPGPVPRFPMLTDPRLAHLPLVLYVEPPAPVGRPVFVPSPSRPLTVALAAPEPCEAFAR